MPGCQDVLCARLQLMGKSFSETTNGLLRQYFLKKTNLRNINSNQLNDGMYKLNYIPRKCLDFETPDEVFYNLRSKPISLRFVAL